MMLLVYAFAIAISVLAYYLTERSRTKVHMPQHMDARLHADSVIG